jgi:hypothetical protein
MSVGREQHAVRGTTSTREARALTALPDALGSLLERAAAVSTAPDAGACAAAMNVLSPRFVTGFT